MARMYEILIQYFRVRMLDGRSFRFTESTMLGLEIPVQNSPGYY